jgi:cytoskeletal protein RodZ
MNRSSAPTPPAYSGKSLGGILSGRREERGILIEQAARATRIRARRLQELENDDISNFSHPSYARLFMQDYAKYLGIPLADIRAFLPESGSYGGEGYDYLNEIPGDPAAGRMARRIQPRRRLVPALVGIALLTLTVLGGFQIWRTMRNLDRIGSAPVANVSRPVKVVEDESSSQPVSQAAVRVGASPEIFSPQVLGIESYVQEDRAILFVRGAAKGPLESDQQVLHRQGL